MDRSSPYYMVIDYTDSKSREVILAYKNYSGPNHPRGMGLNEIPSSRCRAETPDEACRFADIEKYGNEKSKLFDLEKTPYSDDAEYVAIEWVEIFPERWGNGWLLYQQKKHTLQCFKRVRINRFPWLSDKIWDIVKIIVSALVGFTLGKFLQW